MPESTASEPVEELLIKRVKLSPDLIEVSVRNDGADEVTIAQLIINGSYWKFESDTDRPLRRHIGMPAADDEGEAVSHQKSVCVRGRHASATQIGVERFPSAIADAVEQGLIPPLHVDGLHDDQIDIVFDVPARVLRGFIDVDDPRVSAMLGVGFADGASTQDFVLTHLSEDLASEGR